MRQIAGRAVRAAALCGLVFFAACDSSGNGNPAGKVALVDLEEVARALGREGVLSAYELGAGTAQGESAGAPAGETAAPATNDADRQRQLSESLIRNFRAEVRPVARRIAQEQGMSIVLAKRDDIVLYTGRTNEITEQVIDELQGQGDSGSDGGGSSGGGSGDGGSGDSGGDGGSGGSGSGGNGGADGSSESSGD